MYEPPHNREERPEVLHELIRSRPLGLLITAGRRGLSANAVPFVLHAEDKGAVVLECHLSKANPQWREFADGAECLVVFQGPQAYVTPSWYPSKQEHGKAVPTWNYVIVQARGRGWMMEHPAWLRRHLEELTDANEATFEEPWRVADAPEEYLASQLKGIVGVRVEVAKLTGKWKVSQNRSRADQEGVVRGLEELGGEPAEVAAVMRERLSEHS